MPPSMAARLLGESLYDAVARGSSALQANSWVGCSKMECGTCCVQNATWIFAIY